MAAYQEHGTWNMKEVFPDDWGSYRRYEIGQAYRKAPYQQPTKLDINIPGFPHADHEARAVGHHHRVPLP